MREWREKCDIKKILKKYNQEYDDESLVDYIFDVAEEIIKELETTQTFKNDYEIEKDNLRWCIDLEEFRDALDTIYNIADAEWVWLGL